jgi:hypothetical protein
MAQPLFQQHPLQTYFRGQFYNTSLSIRTYPHHPPVSDVGEAADAMPGGLPEFPLHFDGDCDAPRSASDDEETDLNWVSSPIIAVLDASILISLFSSLLSNPFFSYFTLS